MIQVFDFLVVGVVKGQAVLKICCLLEGGQHCDVSWLKSCTFKKPGEIFAEAVY